MGACCCCCWTPPNWNVAVLEEEEEEVGAEDAAAAPVVLAVEEAPNWNVLLAGGVEVAAIVPAAPQPPNRDLAGVEVMVLAVLDEAEAGWLGASPPNRLVPPPAAGADTVVAAATEADDVDVAAGWPNTLPPPVLPKMFVKVGTEGLLPGAEAGAVVDAPKMGLKPEAGSVADVPEPKVAMPDEDAGGAAEAEDEEAELACGVAEAMVAVGLTRPNRVAPLEGGCRG